ncbi:hypothetical protein [Streptomyces albipurpureus]|uniref:hypothetical protein n=1 Tax=Streptomyces albipurpureus TaxID=2897419 RepID=UPI0027E55552|nr:hypothetical protein [Streptomyces sp. CWNU-1]
MQPAAGAPGSADATAYLPPVQPAPQGAVAHSGAGAGAPGSSDATQYIPPVPAGSSGGMDATRMIPPVQPAAGAPGSSDATAYLPPVQSAPQGADATAYLPPVAPGALPPEGFAAPQGPANSVGPQEPATQYPPPIPDAPTSAPYGIRPGAPGDRPPPAEFDNLFRTSAAVGAAQQPPRAQGVPPQTPPPPSRRRQGGSGPRRGSSFPVPVVAIAVIVGCAVLGLGASALIFGGEDDGKPDPGPGTNAAATSPTPSTANSPKAAAADPAERQAKALDTLLADSNDSRAVVIQSVANIRECKNLDQAATDLRGAADQRRGLVDRLQKLTVDRLPKHGELTQSLTSAWKASAAADDHYAAWAQQVKGKNGCRDGQARGSKRAGQGNRASGEATKAKKEAAGLWNPIAARHGLTERRSEQL